MIIIDQGRAVDERSAVWVDQGLIKGFTYFNLNFQITNIDVFLIEMTNNDFCEYIYDF